MYINIGKIAGRLGIALALIILLYGVITFALSLTVQDQIAGSLAAIFGLQLLWFIIWQGRTKRVSRSSLAKNDPAPSHQSIRHDNDRHPNY